MARATSSFRMRHEYHRFRTREFPGQIQAGRYSTTETNFSGRRFFFTNSGAFSHTRRHALLGLRVARLVLRFRYLSLRCTDVRSARSFPACCPSASICAHLPSPCFSHRPRKYASSAADRSGPSRPSDPGVVRAARGASAAGATGVPPCVGRPSPCDAPHATVAHPARRRRRSSASVVGAAPSFALRRRAASAPGDKSSSSSVP